MKLTVLGSGTGIPSAARNAPGYLLEVSGHSFLIDCGSGILRQLERAGRHFEELTGIFLTHTHPDHIGDVVPLVHACRLPGVTRSRPLPIFGPTGIDHFFATFVTPLTGLPSAFPLEIAAAAAEECLGPVRVVSAPTVHSDAMASLAYRFEAGGRAVVLSGDCDWDPGIVNLAEGADLVVLDCSTLAAGKVRGHLSAEECGRVGAAAGAKRLLLSHLYPVAADDADEARLQECRTLFAGDIAIARDFQEIEI
ncbi:MAG: MBL fold metallo-hydrolase [Magnetococcales bacterium]|nr:MBL fold metallo-hydrolase [Magnetococcales bacterium]MBF0157746.1 MBL fold metallo-hydrolase [Magnetococcales bacterium]